MCRPEQDNERYSFQPWGNLKQPMPFWRKLRLLVGNNLIKLRTRKGCCGNYDQPGC
jgi:hypothetical protein